MAQPLSRQELFTWINTILAEWDPIGVGSNIATDEYAGYVPEIVAAQEHGRSIYELLADIVRRMELGFDEDNPVHVADIQKVADRITAVFDR